VCVRLHYETDILTQWLIGHTEYFLETEASGSITSTKHIAVATATADADGVKAGTVSIVIPPGLAAALQNSANAAAQACSAGSAIAPVANAANNGPIFSNNTANSTASSLAKRDGDVLACLVRQAQTIAKNAEVWGELDGDVIGSFVLDLAQNANKLIIGAFQVAVSQAEKNKIAIALWATAAASVALEAGVLYETSPKVVIPPDFGVPKEQSKGCTSPGDKNENSVSRWLCPRSWRIY
jgi:hypothetical protein